MKQLDAEALAEQIIGLSEQAKGDIVRDILVELEESLKQGPIEGETDTWESGFRAAVETISQNYNHT